MVPRKPLPLAPCALSLVSSMQDWARWWWHTDPVQWLSKWVVLRGRGAGEWARPRPGVGVTLTRQVTSS